jgi:hypothetical protein
VEVIKVDNQLEFDSFVQPGVMLTVQSTAHQIIHFGLCTALISMALALISNYKCKALRAVDRTSLGPVRITPFILPLDVVKGH